MIAATRCAGEEFREEEFPELQKVRPAGIDGELIE